MRARTGRALVAVLLVTAAAAAVAQSASPPPTQAAVAAVAQAPADAGTWYCPVTGTGEDQTVLSVAAAGEAATRVTITRYGPSGPVPGEAVTVEPGGVHETALAPGDASPLEVRWSGGPATAAVRLQGPTGVASLACEPGPQQQWLLPGLDTAAGSQSLLHLHNPYEGDAVVQVSFATADGRVERLLGDAVVVPAHGAIQLDVGELEPERLDLGVMVSVRAGRVVAAGEVRMDPPEGLSGPTGRALVGAVPGAAGWWAFADARQSDSADSWLSLLNPGEVDAAVEVRVSEPLPGGGPPEEVTVPAGGVVRVPLAETSSAPEFGVQVESVNGVGVAAALVTDVRSGAGRELSASSGATVGATRWSLVGAGTAVQSSVAVVHNPGAESATVSVAAPGAPRAWRSVQLGANSRVALAGSEISGAQAPAALAFVVVADRPVVAEVRTTTSEQPLRAWTVGGVPARAWSGPAERPEVVRDPRLSGRSTTVPQVGP